MRRRHRSAKARSSLSGGSAPPLRLSRSAKYGKEGTYWSFSDYNAYLESRAWAAKRRQVLARDVHCRAKDCKIKRSLHVHHRRYPRVLGQEPNAWLFALCPRHHAAVHLIVEKDPSISVAVATDMIIGALPTTTENGFRVVHLPDGERPPAPTWGLGKQRKPRKVKTRRGNTQKSWTAESKTKHRRAT